MEKKDIAEVIGKNNIKYIKMMFMDLHGIPKCMEISVGALDAALENKIQFDGSSIVGLSNVNRSDLVLAPDPSSFRHLPMFDSPIGNVGMFLCDILMPDGTANPGCTRSNLRSTLAKMNKMGFCTANIGFEPEFFLFKTKPNKETTRDQLMTDSAGYAASEAADPGAGIRREMIYEMGKLGIKCLTSHHELAPSQHEISYMYTDALNACDNLLIFRMVAKEVAIRHGLYACFLPKPVDGINGNGLHTHVSLNKDGANAFAGKDGLSSVAKHFIAGVLAHARGLCFLTNPSVNSYKRLVPGYEAPTSICWGHCNRSAMIRIPSASGNSSRIEVRNPDNSNNPYIAINGLLSAGLSGIEKKMPVPKEVTYSVYKEKPADIPHLPTSLHEAMVEFKKDAVLTGCLTEHVWNLLLEEKAKEIENV